MATRPALVRLVTAAADQVVHDFLSAQGFAPAQPIATETLRRYVSQREFRDVEIDIFGDAAASGEGMVVRIRVRSLVHPVQQVLGGVDQTLLAPRTGQPLTQFELGPHADDLPGTWRVRGPNDVGRFASGLLVYLNDVAVPWLRHTESMDAVLAHLAEMGHAEQCDRLRKAWGDARP